ncbi:hypothetical protein CFO_g4209 [Ceratocystis platani]|uniref:CENP-T/Histone H4 histone fold domain-containing protein n=1 Tax=Ceratocystis fimbriata f. sp. platani TaxID=88771 RepID=A0A0F8BM16_CERFI|nr:hypothetical protein CFO_g4209 [Ceratocystis platani]
MSSPGSSPPPTTRVALATPARPTGNSAARAVRTPLDKTAPRDLLNSVRRGQSSVRNRIATNAPTPHARAAIRALDMRRAAVFTPGKGRRKSVRDQRETPRDILHKKSPERSMVGDQTDISNGMDYDEDDDDDVLMRRPEFTLPLDEGDEDDDDLVAPRSMLLEDETMGNLTMQSMEFPRRATNDILVDRRLSRMSMGSVRFSDVAGDLTMQRIDDTTGHDVTSGNGDLSVPEQESLFVELRSQSPDSPEPFGDISQLQNLKPEPEPTQHDMSMEDDGAGVSAGGREFLPLMQLESEDEDQGEIEDIPDITFDSRMEEQQREARKKGIKLSAYGIEYPSIPPSVVKRLALMFAQRSGLGKCKISPETLQQLSLATDWFFEQVGSDLKAYAEHANRKTIDESDVALLMRRQRQISSTCAQDEEIQIFAVSFQRCDYHVALLAITHTGTYQHLLVMPKAALCVNTAEVKFRHCLWIYVQRQREWRTQKTVL